MSENLNHTCDICGEKYHFCTTCSNIESFTPWRTIVDSIEHYKIFLIIRDYTNKNISKDEAKTQLEELDLSELDSFVTEIKTVIKEIMAENLVINNTKSAIKNKK